MIKTILNMILRCHKQIVHFKNKFEFEMIILKLLKTKFKVENV